MANPNSAKIEYAFQCKNCNSLEGPDAAGELEVPTACRVCGKGVSFDEESGARILEPDNWIVLADLKEKELAKFSKDYGIDPDFHRIVAHTPAAPGPQGGANIDRSAEETVGGEDQA